MNLIDFIIDYFDSSFSQLLFLRLKVFSAMLSFLFFSGIIYLLVKTRFIESKFKKFEGIFKSQEIQLPKKQINKFWVKILKRVEKDSEAEWKLALIEADKIFDDLLKRMGYKGKDQAERMQQVTPLQFSNINELWQAHKIRNRLVHEPDFHINQDEAIFFLKAYEKAFRDLALLE